MSYLAYTYTIKCPNGKSYYGYRSANKVSPEDDLWKKYFTSSKHVKELREQYDDSEFVASVDKTFESAEEAHGYETKFLIENNCVRSEGWLNEQCFPVFAFSEESRKKISEAKKGMKLSEEHKKKLSEAGKGKKFSEEHKKNMSEAKKGQVPWNKGKTGVYSEESRKKMCESHIGHVPWNKGKTGVYSEEHLKKMSEARKGKKFSEEHKKNLRKAVKAYYAKKRNGEHVTTKIHE